MVATGATRALVFLACIFFASGIVANPHPRRNVNLLHRSKQVSKGQEVTWPYPYGEPGQLWKTTWKYRHLSGNRLEAFCAFKHKFGRIYRAGYVKPRPKEWGLPACFEPGCGVPKTCAVVSSSGALRSREWGQEIDNHDIVFRFNSAPTEGFEKYVGSKTTFRLGHDFPAGCPDSVCEQYPCNVFTKQPDRAKVANIHEIMSGVPSHPSNMTAKLTTGFHGMLHALADCASIDTYEMVPSEAAKKYRYHYWENGNGGGKDSGPTAHKNLWHGYSEAEHQVWKYLSVSTIGNIDASGKASLPGFNSVNCVGHGAVDRFLAGYGNVLENRLEYDDPAVADAVQLLDLDSLVAEEEALATKLRSTLNKTSA